MIMSENKYKYFSRTKEDNKYTNRITNWLVFASFFRCYVTHHSQACKILPSKVKTDCSELLGLKVSEVLVVMVYNLV